MMELLGILAKYKSLFLITFEILLIIVFVNIARGMYYKWKSNRDEGKKDENQKVLTSGHFNGTVHENQRQAVIRQIVAPDGVNVAPNSYMCISDGGREVYVRSVTISKLPKKVRYAETLKQLLDFPNCTCTCFVEPIDASEMSRKLDRQINILGAEEIAESGDTNRVRRLGQQVDEVTQWAEQVETGDKRFFKVGFLFSFMAESVEELNKITDSFRMVALKKKMDISNCYGVQPEAYLANMPFNRCGNMNFINIHSDAVMMHLMDQKSVSVILNYTQDYFSHRRGVPLGRNLFNGMPFVFDLFEPSHDGNTLVMCGKTRSGKTATIKMIMERSIPQGIRFVCIDSQRRKGTSEGEYASVTEVNGGINFQISSSNRNILNIFQLQESKEWVKTSADSGYEKRTLDLNGAITEMVYNLRSMMQIGANDKDKELDVVLDSDINTILTDTVKELFAERGIVHGDPDSLYEEGNVVRGALLQSGYVPKKLPIMTDFYKKILEEKWRNKDVKMESAYKFIINNLREYVRELYYVEESGLFFTREQYEKLPMDPDKKTGRVYQNEEDEFEQVVEFRGIRPYFDGQSTLISSEGCSVVNIDISLLTEKERKVAREIAIHYVTEQFIKKNSENFDGADKLVCIIDEAHETFDYMYGRKTFANVTRTAAKRKVGMIYCTQTVAEFDRYAETSDILKQAAMKMIFKQDGQDRDILKRVLNITHSQANIITNMLGVVTDKEDPEAQSKHRGEACVIDGEQVLFIKVDYLRRTEGLSVEAEASKVMKRINMAE